MFDIVVIGGGAAGLVASICAAWQCRTQGTRAHIALFEANDRVGRSILATGNGRCNFSNAHITPDVYRNAAFVRDVFASLEEQAFWKSLPSVAGAAGAGNGANTVDVGATITGNAGMAGAGTNEHAPSDTKNGSANAILHLFVCLGLVWREEAQGRLFPQTNKASTVLDVLRAAAAALGVQECCNMQVRAVEPPQDSQELFTLQVEHGAPVGARAVICAVGGTVAQKLLPCAFAYTPLHPVLGPLKTCVHTTRALDNLRVRCVATLMRNGTPVACEEGEVLFRSYGLSGIAIFNLSRFAHTGDVVSLDICPAFSPSELEAHLREHTEVLGQLYSKAITWEDVLRGMVLPLVARAVMRAAGIEQTSLATPDTVKQVAHAFKHFELVVEGTGEARACQVHAGGFACENFCAETMESKHYAGLFAAGEMLDVDAPCGGYNLHWAWASGALAGVSAAKRLASASTSSTSRSANTRATRQHATHTHASNTRATRQHAKRAAITRNPNTSTSQGGCS